MSRLVATTEVERRERLCTAGITTPSPCCGRTLFYAPYGQLKRFACSGCGKVWLFKRTFVDYWRNWRIGDLCWAIVGFALGLFLGWALS